MKNQKKVVKTLFIFLLTILIMGCTKSSDNKSSDNTYGISDCERFENDNQTYLDCVMCLKEKDTNAVKSCIEEVDKFVMEKKAYLEELYSSPEKMKITCSQIEDEEKRNLCYYYIAFNQTDVSACNLITEEKLGINCVTATYNALHDQTNCQGLSESDTDFCYLYAAIAKNETTLCNNIVDEEYKKLCSENVI